MCPSGLPRLISTARILLHGSIQKAAVALYSVTFSALDDPVVESYDARTCWWSGLFKSESVHVERVRNNRVCLVGNEAKIAAPVPDGPTNIALLQGRSNIMKVASP